MGDVDGDARDDVCARTADGVRCWRSEGDAFGPAIVGPEWSNASGWGRVPYWSTLRLVDVDGDRRADLCARAAAGLRCHLSTGDGFGPAIEGPEWSDASGWGDYANYSTIRFGDLDGDGDRDVCARANAGVRCHPWEGGGFGANLGGPTLSDASGWGSIRFFSTLRFQDVDGDGAEELCARGSAGVRCWSIADGFAASTAGPAWSDEVGWDAPRYYETIRGVTPRDRCVVDEVCGNGADDDCDGEVDEGCGSSSSAGGDDPSGAASGSGGASAAGGGASSSPAGGTGLASGAGGSGADGASGDDVEGSGCGCRVAPARSTPALLAAGALALGLAARRRRR
jgi:MYXO-CTERM domain-containing protein